MKLLLSSYRLGAHGPQLRGLLGDGTKAGLVFNALDQYETRLRELPRERADLTDIGLDCEELDLRDYFGDEHGLRQRLDDLDLIWVPGGNTFVLARAMVLSGVQSAATTAVHDGRLVYAGYSAGACITAPDLRGLHLMDDPSVVPGGYPVEPRSKLSTGCRGGSFLIGDRTMARQLPRRQQPSTSSSRGWRFAR